MDAVRRNLLLQQELETLDQCNEIEGVKLKKLLCSIIENVEGMQVCYHRETATDHVKILKDLGAELIVVANSYGCLLREKRRVEGGLKSTSA